MNGRLRRTVILLAAAAAPAVVWGAPPRIAVAPVNGDRGGAVTKQLRSLLCADFECVPYSRVRTGGRLDFKKAGALGVAGILVGTATTSRRGKFLELALLRRSLRPAWKASYPLVKAGTLGRDAARDLSLDVADQLEGPRPPAPPAEPPPLAAPPPPAAAPPVAVAPPAAAPPAAPSAAAKPEPEPAVAAPELAAAPRQPAKPAAAPAEGPPPARRPPPTVGVEAGVALAQRTLSYQGVPAGNPLRGLKANLVVSPAFRLELYPLALLTRGALAGLGLFGDYAFSVGLTTQDPSGGADHSTSFSRLGAGLLWRVEPVSGSRFALIPAVSYQALKFTVGGAPIAGLPDTDLSGFKAGLDAEIPLGGAVAILLGAGYVYWSTAAELVGDAFFRSGSAYALEADAGVSVGLGGAFSLRLLGDYSGTQYSLEPSPGGTYQATGASDRYLGGRAMLRAQF